MCETSAPQLSAAHRILNAADVLMASEGVANLSTHKIAKAAGLSVGTIYLHFKDKDDLLAQLVVYLFDRFQQMMSGAYDDNLPLLTQYQAFWHSTWQFMGENPNIVLNMHQYESLPDFQQLILSCLEAENSAWQRFVVSGQEAGQLARLPSYVLFAMSMKVAWQLKYLELISAQPFPNAVLEEVVLRTWKAITV